MSSIEKAKQICPEIIIVNGEVLTPYREASERIFHLLQKRFPAASLERLGLDEVFLDLTEEAAAEAAKDPSHLKVGCFALRLTLTPVASPCVRRAPLRLLPTSPRNPPSLETHSGRPSGRGMWLARAQSPVHAGATHGSARRLASPWIFALFCARSSGTTRAPASATTKLPQKSRASRTVPTTRHVFCRTRSSE